MVELTTAAKRCLDDYLGEMRASLRGCPSVDSADVERDVTEHIEKSLAEAPSPVESSALQEVLEQLGSPSQWIPEEELSWWRKLVVAWRSGPEDFRLGYISIAILGAGALSLGLEAPPAIPFVCVVFSFLFSRAAVAAAADPAELGPQRWLLYPALISVYFIFLACVLFWPVVPACALADPSVEAEFTFHDITELEPRSEPLRTGVSEGIPLSIRLSTLFGIASTAFWWFLLGLVGWRWPVLVRNTFYPFANGFRGLHAIVFGGFGLLVFVGMLAFLS